MGKTCCSDENEYQANNFVPIHISLSIAAKLQDWVPGRVSCTQRSCGPALEWQLGFHSDLSGLVCPNSVFFALP